jgi:hypothetical protein
MSRRRERLGKRDILKALEEMIKTYDHLPDHAKYSPVTHSDLQSVFLILQSIVLSDLCKSDS